MKRSLYLLSFLLLGACGKYEYQGEFIGKKLSEVKIDAYTGADADALNLACSAFATKESLLNPSITSTAELQFNMTVSNCGGEFVRASQTVKIEQEGDNYVFKPDFAFKEVETTKKGILAPVCQNVSLFTGQYEEGDRIVLVRTAENGTVCPKQQGKVCLQFIKVQKSTDIIVSREFMRVRHSNNGNTKYRGFFDWRRLSAQSINCAENQFTTIEAALAD